MGRGPAEAGRTWRALRASIVLRRVLYLFFVVGLGPRGAADKRGLALGLGLGGSRGATYRVRREP